VYAAVTQLVYGAARASIENVLARRTGVSATEW
jgi:hypothetical protein